MSHTDHHKPKFILNLDEVEHHHHELSYAELVFLAYPQDPPADTSDIIYTITIEYMKGEIISFARGDKPVAIKQGMVCNVRKTGRS